MNWKGPDEKSPWLKANMHSLSLRQARVVFAQDSYTIRNSLAIEATWDPIEHHIHEVVVTPEYSTGKYSARESLSIQTKKHVYLEERLKAEILPNHRTDRQE